MYADDLALIAFSAQEVQGTVDVVSHAVYATKWRYWINPLMSNVLV